MQVSDVLNMVEDQNRGRWFELLNPVDGSPLGISLLVAGPDSRVQADALALMTDDLAEVAGPDGRVKGADRAACHRKLLARCILDWRATEGGEAVAFSHAAVLRLLAVAFVQSQADAFAGNRSVYFALGGDDAAA